MSFLNFQIANLTQAFNYTSLFLYNIISVCSICAEQPNNDNETDKDKYNRQ